MVTRSDIPAVMHELVAELTMWDVPQTCGECGGFCDRTALGNAVNALKADGETTPKMEYYGEPCGEE